eukprot:UN05813
MQNEMYLYLPDSLQYNPYGAQGHGVHGNHPYESVDGQYEFCDLREVDMIVGYDEESDTHDISPQMDLSFLFPPLPELDLEETDDPNQRMVYLIWRGLGT